MLRFIGAVVVASALVGGFLYFGGYVDGSASAAVTNKGREALNSGVTAVQDGLDNLRTGTGEAKE